jgi:putative hydrolase of the HAD superfamily
MTERVLWDFAGVLCRFEPDRRTRALSRLTGCPESQVEEVVDDDLIDAADEGRMSVAEIFDALRTGLGWDGGDDALRAAWLEAFEVDTAAVDLARRVEVAQGLLTNNGPPLSDRFDQSFPEVAAVVDLAVFSSDLGFRKPAAEAFTIACQRLGAPPRHVLFVDDSADNIDGAARVGLDVHHFTDLDALTAALEERGVLGGLRGR